MVDVVRARRLPFPGPGIEAVVFDLDGVVTDTAGIHEAAWGSVFNEFLHARAEAGGEPFEPFTAEDYGRYVDGKPRYEGAVSFLASRGVDLPVGDPSDPPGDTSVSALANRKNESFIALLAEQPVEPYPETIRVIRELRSSGVQVGLITSSRNGRAVARAAGITPLFNAIIDGVDAAQAGLAGKPSPDIFLAATMLLGSVPERTAIVEDSQAGVSAGREAGFGFVLGVDRLGRAPELLASGAHAVVSDLGDVTVTTRPLTHEAAAELLAPQAPATTPAEQPEGAVVPGTGGERLLSDLPSAAEAAASIAQYLQAGSPIVFLDFDGTLSSIVDDPVSAAVSADVRSSVEQLAALLPVAVVSGRDVADVRARAGIAGVFYAGSHGFEIEAPDGSPVDTGHAHDFAAYLPALDEAEVVLRRQLTGVPGVIIERKRFAIAVHFRMADTLAVPRIELAVENARDDAVVLRMTGGKKVFELRPDLDWDKGSALGVLLGVSGLGSDEALPLYIGDDLTDEDGFRAAQARGGVAIAVLGELDRLSAADYSLEDPAQVGAFLGVLAESLSRAEDRRQ